MKACFRAFAAIDMVRCLNSLRSVAFCLAFLASTCDFDLALSMLCSMALSDFFGSALAPERIDIPKATAISEARKPNLGRVRYRVIFFSTIVRIIGSHE